MTKFVKLALLFGLVTSLMTGCAVNRATGSVDPSAYLSSMKTMYVKKVADDDNTYALIADKLRTKGLVVTTGSDAAPAGVDAVVTYIDKWMWDITMYMLELTITIRDPKPISRWQPATHSTPR
jgi:hypothetical protein